jgi:Tol biopolymer transport system component
MHDISTKEDKLIQSGIRSTISLIPGTNTLIYSKLSEDNKGWANIHDIYSYNIDTKDEKRITNGLRANNPFVSHDGKKIVFVYQKDGTSNIGLVDIDGKNFKRLTFFENGEQVYNPKFSFEDTLIVFDYSYTNGRDIASVKPDGSGFKFVLNSPADERNVYLTKDNKLYFSSDESGIFNIYSYNSSTGEKNQHSNVVGGAFMPDVADNGDILFAGYTSKGYKIFRISNVSQKKVDITKRYLPAEVILSANASPNGGIANFKNLTNFTDYDIPKYESKKYQGAFTNLSFFPFIRYDNYTTSNQVADKIKPGVYIASSDMLDR